MIKIKRIYDSPGDDDGFRILVDRIWPRGIKKENAKIDEWMKEVAPSTALRKWFSHDAAKWTDFKKRYRDELKDNQAFATLKKLLKQKGSVTLLYGAKDEKHNQAVALSEFLKK